MNNRVDSSSIQSNPTVLLLLFLLVSNLFFGCKDRPAEPQNTQAEQASIEISGFQIPVFSSAGEQLNYTRAWFAKIQEKRAALQAFIKLYPQEMRYCGLAALDLAYLQLGSDFRFAEEYAGFAAIKAYRAILDTYIKLPEIMAKAHWYIGWIYTDLLKDTKKGIDEYQQLVSNYPEESVTLLPPAPWVSIIYQTDANVNITLSNKPVNNWAALALVEIIRHTDDEEIAWGAYQKLWGSYRDNVVTGFGLKFMLQKRFHIEETLIMAYQYMEKEFSNVHILGDIQKEINDITAAKGGVIK